MHTIAIAVVKRGDGYFLIGLRSTSVPLSGLWEFPGGKVEIGENAKDAAVRECFEETGLRVEVISKYPDAYYEYPHGPLHFRFFDCQPAEQQQTPKEPFRWVSREDLPKYQFPPANAELLKLLLHG